MLESISERLMDTVHAGSPTKHPTKRLETIEAAGELRIPFTTGILVGIGETSEEQVQSLEALAALHAEYGHLQEVILQNFVPHPRYYGQEVADIADQASRLRWGRDGGRPAGDPNCQPPSGRPPSLPFWASSVDIEDIKRLIRECRRLMPDVGIQVPPNLSDAGPSLWKPVRPILGGCPPTAITSPPRIRSRPRMRCARSWRRAGMR